MNKRQESYVMETMMHRLAELDYVKDDIENNTKLEIELEIIQGICKELDQENEWKWKRYYHS